MYSGKFQSPQYGIPQPQMTPEEHQRPAYLLDTLPQPQISRTRKPVQKQNSYLSTHVGLLVSTVVAIGGFALIFFKFVLPLIGPTPTQTLTTYCNALKNHDYQTAYSQLSSYSTQFADETDFAATMDDTNKFLSGLTDCVVLDVRENRSAGTANGTLNFVYPQGIQNEYHARLVNQNGSWKIIEITA